MSAADVLSTVLHEYALVNGRINKLLEPWDDVRLADQPHGQVNHPAWTLGHLCVVMDSGGALVSAQREIDDTWSKLFGGGSHPTSNRADYPSKTALLNRYNALTQKFVDALRNAPEQVLTSPNPLERALARFPQTGQLVVHMLTAEPGYHLGQMTGWCRAMGWQVKF